MVATSQPKPIARGIFTNASFHQERGESIKPINPSRPPCTQCFSFIQEIVAQICNRAQHRFEIGAPNGFELWEGRSKEGNRTDEWSDLRVAMLRMLPMNRCMVCVAARGPAMRSPGKEKDYYETIGCDWRRLLEF